MLAYGLVHGWKCLNYVSYWHVTFTLTFRAKSVCYIQAALGFKEILNTDESLNLAAASNVGNPHSLTRTLICLDVGINFEAITNGIGRELVTTPKDVLLFRSSFWQHSPFIPIRLFLRLWQAMEPYVSSREIILITWFIISWYVIHTHNAPGLLGPCFVVLIIIFIN